MAESSRDWELNQLRMQAHSLNSHRSVEVQGKIHDLDWQRKSHNFSELDRSDRTRMDWEVQRLKSAISSQQSEQMQDEERARQMLKRERREEQARQREWLQGAAAWALTQPALGLRSKVIEQKEHEHFITQEEIAQARELRDTHQLNYQSEEYWLHEIKRFNMMSEPDRRKIVEAANGTPLAFYLSLTPLARVGFREEILSAE
jgi:hypothetical protein